MKRCGSIILSLFIMIMMSGCGDKGLSLIQPNQKINITQIMESSLEEVCDLEKDMMAETEKVLVSKIPLVSNKELKEIYCILGKIRYFNNDYINAYQYFKSAEALPEALEGKFQLTIYNGLAKTCIRTGKDEDYIKYLIKIAEEATKNNYYEDLARIYRTASKRIVEGENGIEYSIQILQAIRRFPVSINTLGWISNDLSVRYMHDYQLGLSMEYILRGLEYAKQSNDRGLEIELHQNLAANYSLQGDYKTAISIQEQLLAEPDIKESRQYVRILECLLNDYMQIGKFNEVDKIFTELIRIIKSRPQEQQTGDLAWSYLTYARVKCLQESYVEAYSYIKRAEEQYLKAPWDTYTGTDINIVQLYGNVYMHTEGYEKALPYYLVVLDKMDERGIVGTEKMEVLDRIIEIYQYKNDLNKTNYYLNERLILEKSINYSDKEKSAQHVIEQFKFNKSVAEKERLEREKERIGYGAIILAVGFIVVGWKQVKIIKQNKEIKILNKELEVLSKQDPLTKVLNKRMLYVVMDELLHQQVKEIIMVMIDIDYFKEYNDTYGHLEGDIALTQVAELINNSFGRETEAVIRYGGEEFCVIVYDESLKNIIAKVEEMRHELGRMKIPHKASKVNKWLTLSIGIASKSVINKEDFNTLLKLADERLYFSKSKGRNQYTVAKNNTSKST